MVGRVHSIETMGTLEGPGIRFVVFLQGCPLRCLFCHNPDTWQVDAGTGMEVERLLEELDGYRSFIDASGGGITCTGGEPLLQAGFVAEFFERCRSLGIHTALDTSGYAELSDAVIRVLEHTDLVLLDIKHSHEKGHRKLTGVSFETIERFARYVDRSASDLWVRHVLIPGYTLEPQVLKATAAFIGSLGTVSRVDLLPYHELGKHKWEALGKRYPLAEIRPPDQNEVDRAYQVFLEARLPVHGS